MLSESFGLKLLKYHCASARIWAYPNRERDRVASDELWFPGSFCVFSFPSSHFFLLVLSLQHPTAAAARRGTPFPTSLGIIGSLDTRPRKNGGYESSLNTILYFPVMSGRHWSSCLFGFGLFESGVFKSWCSLNQVGYALAFTQEPAGGSRQERGFRLAYSSWYDGLYFFRLFGFRLS